eukprot:3027970-Pyramimonas_sp.AAC.1
MLAARADPPSSPRGRAPGGETAAAELRRRRRRRTGRANAEAHPRTQKPKAPQGVPRESPKSIKSPSRKGPMKQMPQKPRGPRAPEP